MKNNKGFTLIEMLVVIAIIGLLSSVVLVALGPSRTKAKDARVISNMNQVQVLEETLFNNGTYTTLSLTAEPGLSLENDVKANNGNTGITIIGAGGAAAYAAYTSLSSGYYCVDSKGNSVNLTSVTAVIAATPYCK